VVLCEQRRPGLAHLVVVHQADPRRLRYLEYYEFSLVRKALQEREVLLRSAPHIMWPLRFVMPHDPACARPG
jgi:glycerol-3-phosphate dehydrogenase